LQTAVYCLSSALWSCNSMIFDIQTSLDPECILGHSH